MPADIELLAIADAMTELQQRFVNSSKELFLQTEDQAEFKRLALEAKVMLDDALGRANDFSFGLISAVNSGSGGFLGGPSYACVTDAISIIRGGVNQIRRRAGTAPLRITKEPYVDVARLAEIRAASSTDWDLTRLAQLCAELNVAHQHDCHMSVAMLVRTIVDHVPLVFGCGSFSEVANNYRGSQSFRRSMQHLDQSLRNIADAHLHTHIRRRESVPTGAQVAFRQDLDVLLAEVLRVVGLQGVPRRETGT